MKSANQGDSEGQFEVGKCYLEGNGISKSEKEAYIWLQKSASQGNLDAKRLLKIE